MKHFYTLLLTVICANVLIAQPKKNTSDRLKMHQAVLEQLMHPSAPETGTRDITSGPTERVIAQRTKDNTGAKTDSVKLTYGLNDTSSYDFNMMEYAYNYPYNTSPMFNYLGVYTKPQVLFNSYYHWTIDPNTLVYGFYEKDFAHYNLQKSMLSDTAFFADSTLNPNMVYSNKFNAANNIDTGYSSNYMGGVASNTFKQFFKYNTSNKLVKDSMYEFHSGSWYLVAKTNYTYDVSNNLIQIDNYANNSDPTFTLPLVEQLQYINTYDVSNRLLTVLTSYYDGTSLSQSVKDTFAYTGVHPFHTSWKQYQYDIINSYWAPMTYMSKHLNAAGYPDIVNVQTFDSLTNAWVPASKQLVKYDIYNNPDTLRDYEYNFTSFPSTPSFTTIYYYEAVTITTAVDDIKDQDNDIKIYPNPATDIITISIPDAKSTAAFITVYDVEGRMLQREKLSQHFGSFQLSVSDLTPGVYFTIIQDESGAMIHRQAVVKD